MPTRILIADDDKTIRLLLRRILEAHASWEVCADARDGKDAIEKAVQFHPDLIILDLAMPVMNGFQAAEQLSKNSPNIPLLLISVQQVTTYLEKSARNVGFKGAITKSSGAEVVTAVEALLRSETFFAVEGSSRIA
jgi:two-component system, NarL family, nitrate/nitrite response regulator NarL